MRPRYFFSSTTREAVSVVVPVPTTRTRSPALTSEIGTAAFVVRERTLVPESRTKVSVTLSAATMVTEVADTAVTWPRMALCVVNALVFLFSRTQVMCTVPRRRLTTC